MTITAKPSTVVAPARRHRGIRILLALVAVAVVAWQLPSVVSALTAAGRAAAAASPLWLAVGLVATVGSMAAFGAVRRRTLAMAGARISWARATSVSYAAGAVHLTAPAGTVFSTAYAFRRLRGLGLNAAAVTFSLAVSGVVSAITLAGLAVTGIAAGSASWSTLVPGIAGALALAAVAGWIVRHPDVVARVAERVLPHVNRLLRRPREAGLISIRTAVADVGYVRPTSRTVLAATAAAIMNWLLDLLCLWACAQAVGIAVTPWALLGCYALAMAGAGVSPLPGGVGVVDGLLLVGLTAAGAPVAVALTAVGLYRLLSSGSVIGIGWAAVAWAKRSDRAAAVSA